MRKLLTAKGRIGIAIAVAASGVLTLASAGSSAFKDAPKVNGAGHVVLLHGLARSATSMTKLAESLQAHGYTVCNVEYPSRDYSIEVLAKEHVAPAIKLCFPQQEQIHFVTHSLGGIIVRQLAEQSAKGRIGRVVMLSPPNHGSEVVDKLGNVWGFGWLNGPAGLELGTGAESLPLKLGPAKFEVGIITGVRSINPFLSTLIPGQDDGKVGVEHAKLDGMSDFIVLRCSHPFIMKSDRAIEQTLHFLKYGSFRHDTLATTMPEHNAEPGDCWD
jgi:triacylglycerol lipase